ncbi:hypothetical protein MPH_00102 [Macrophomina phaseolina MS6]|uniref:Uncharacterized protein n=1 Tax=Macrophomina phaseolina (strain MS6) TaxID=1126212 RepID=K2SJF8_MACPH|nr:hypothetical protein MPH_00102 [Macrophomina phaseolina MS6]
MAQTEARVFTFGRNDDEIKSQRMPIVAPGWTRLTSKHWDLRHSPNVPHFDDGVPELPAGVPADHPQAKEYYAYVEKVAPFYPSALALYLLRSLKQSVGDDAEFAKFKGLVEEALKEGDFELEQY